MAKSTWRSEFEISILSVGPIGPIQKHATPLAISLNSGGNSWQERIEKPDDGAGPHQSRGDRMPSEGNGKKIVKGVVRSLASEQSPQDNCSGYRSDYLLRWGCTERYKVALAVAF
jgi:hypothetical protein